MSTWKRIDDGLPDEHGEYLVMSAAGRKYVAIYDGATFRVAKASYTPKLFAWCEIPEVDIAYEQKYIPGAKDALLIYAKDKGVSFADVARELNISAAGLYAQTNRATQEDLLRYRAVIDKIANEGVDRGYMSLANKILGGK